MKPLRRLLLQFLWSYATTIALFLLLPLGKSTLTLTLGKSSEDSCEFPKIEDISPRLKIDEVEILPTGESLTMPFPTSCHREK